MFKLHWFSRVHPIVSTNINNNDLFDCKIAVLYLVLGGCTIHRSYILVWNSCFVYTNLTSCYLSKLVPNFTKSLQKQVILENNPPEGNFDLE